MIRRDSNTGYFRQNTPSARDTATTSHNKPFLDTMAWAALLIAATFIGAGSFINAELRALRAESKLKDVTEQLTTGHVGQFFYIADGDKCKPIKVQFNGYNFRVSSDGEVMPLMQDRNGYYATQANGIEVRCYQIDKVLW